MKNKQLIERLQELNPESNVDFLTGPGQWGKVVGVHEEPISRKNQKFPKVLRHLKQLLPTRIPFLFPNIAH